ncbi:MAG: ArgE/DapE family deacylase [Candidatus Bathyarchaeota archaeon]|nr:ArgE/DapE family deacylase [Candidatus Bathyarchaeota archaeon]
MPTLDEALSKISREEIVELSKRLIRVPSVTGEERRVILLARDIIEGLGIETRLLGSEERPILTATINPEAKRLVAFNGHLDVVPPASLDAWSHDPYDPQLTGNTLTGRGSCDMKSACAVMIHVAGIIKDQGLPLGVALHLVPDEEKGATHGTKMLLDEVKKGNLRRPDYAVIGEKSNLKLRIAERGGWGFKIRFRGRATHTAYARYEGVNAIAKASKGVLALEKPIDKWHPWIGAPVLSVNAVQAGTAGNQVPDECTISIDRRLIPGETPETVAAEVKQALDEAGKGDPDWRWEIDAPRDVDGKWVYTPANSTSPDTELGKAFKEAVKTALGREPELFVEWAGGTDGAYYREAGIQTIGFGPAGEHMHGPNELVYVDTLVDQARVYLALVHNLSK